MVEMGKKARVAWGIVGALGMALGGFLFVRYGSAEMNPQTWSLAFSGSCLICLSVFPLVASITGGFPR